MTYLAAVHASRNVTCPHAVRVGLIGRYQITVFVRQRARITKYLDGIPKKLIVQNQP